MGENRNGVTMRIIKIRVQFLCSFRAALQRVAKKIAKNRET